MRCEVVAVGTELLLGQIIDTNSSWIGEQLAANGIDSLHQTKVGDNAERIRASIELALSRSDAVVVCGGLGPTQDDITRDVIAEVMGVPLERDEAIAERIAEMFSSRGRPMPANNLRQADVPRGARTMDQQPGTAPGLVCPIGPVGADGHSQKVVYAVPGVPHEMRDMVSGTVLDDLRRRAGETSVIASRVLRTTGQSESGLAEMLAERIDQLDRSASHGGDTATLAFLASGVEGLKIRITAKAVDDAAVRAVIAAEESVVRAILGGLVFGVDDETMESVVLDAVGDRAWKLGVAESVTGGYLASRLTMAPDRANAFAGGFVVSGSESRARLLGGENLPEVGSDVAVAMADGVRTVLGCEVAIATSGVIGSEPVDGHAPGTVFGAVAITGLDTEVVTMRLPSDRERVRQYSCLSLLDLVRRRLQEIDGPR